MYVMCILYIRVLKFIGKNKLMSIDYHSVDVNKNGKAYSGEIKVVFCNLNQGNDKRYDILRKRTFFMKIRKIENNSTEYYKFKKICQINLKNHNFLCSESMGYILERWYKYKKGVYHNLTNNCQHFCVDILSIIDQNQAKKCAKQMSVATAKGWMPYNLSVQHYFYINEIENATQFLTEAVQQFRNVKLKRIQESQIISVVTQNKHILQESNNNNNINVNNSANKPRILNDYDSKDNGTFESKEVNDWNCNDVKEWLTHIKMDKYIKTLCDDNKLNGNDLLDFKTAEHWEAYLVDSTFPDRMTLKKSLKFCEMKSNKINIISDDFLA